MKIKDILTPQRTLCGASGSSKKRVLENIAQFICEDLQALNTFEVFDSLVAREKLGSTGLGAGIAIPHCRIEQCDQVIGSLITLDDAIDFDAIDNAPVDVLFVLLVPSEAHQEHLNVLKSLAESFSDPDFCNALRGASDNQQLYELAIKQ